MEYERIDQIQTGISISPSKLRMKLMGLHHRNKNGSSNNNSSRTSPSRIEDAEFIDSLLDSRNEESHDQVAGLDVVPVKLSDGIMLDSGLNDQNCSQTKESLVREDIEAGRAKLQQFSKINNGNSSAIHPMRALEDEHLDYDSNASSSSFEFQKGERAMHNSMARSYSRPMSSKWNDAEKWIMNRQNVQAAYAKKNSFHNQANRHPMPNTARVAPDSANYELRSAVNHTDGMKRINFYQSAVQMPLEKFSFNPSGAHPISMQAYGGNLLTDQCPQSRDLKEDTTVIPAMRSVCMRDTGTEMTPGTSLEPSRTATPEGATTPFRSPTSSMPSTPRGVAPTSTSLDHAPDDESQHPPNDGKKELSEQERKLKTRREIVALGVRLGKTNIASWASKDKENNSTSVDATCMTELEQNEYEERAVAWEEAENTKHNSRYKREEIKIQAWESQKRAKLEAEMRRIEAKVEQMRAQTEATMVKKIAMAKQRSEEKRIAAEARKNRDTERTSAQAEYIRQTGRIPSSHYMCCSCYP